MTINDRPQWLAVLAALAALAAAPAIADASSSAPAVCAPAVDNGVLPVWARGGFSDARPKIAHITARAGTIMGILFAQPLLSPPGKTHNNKILWVAKQDVTTPSNLRITAQRMAGTHAVGAPVTRVLAGGPGPSIVNLPAAGCWRLGLRWAGHSDSLDVRYASNKK